MIEEILGGGVLAATRILYVCKWSTRLPQHQIYQSDGFFTRWLFYQMAFFTSSNEYPTQNLENRNRSGNRSWVCSQR